MQVTFTRVNGVPDTLFNRVARWNGTTWVPLGGGFNYIVWSVTVMANGDLVAAGEFNSAFGMSCSRVPPDCSGGVTCNRVARWNGVAWSPMGAGFDSSVIDLLTLPNGDLVAGGYFTTADNLPCRSIARWDGAAWRPMPGVAGGVNEFVWHLGLVGTTHLVAAGEFATANDGFSRGVAMYPLANPPRILEQPLDQQLVPGAAASFSVTASASATSFQWHRDGVALSDGARVTGATGPVLHISGVTAADAGSYACDASNSCGTTRSQLAALSARPCDAAQLQSIGGLPGANSEMYTIAFLSNGDLLAGGSFTTIGGQPIRYLARWDGRRWSAMGPPLDAAVRTISVLPGDDIVIGGGFTTCGTEPCNRIARWNGTRWVQIGTGVNGEVRDILRLDGGALAITGPFTHTADGATQLHSIAIWSNSQWRTIGGGLRMGSGVADTFCLARLPNGDIISGGYFDSAGGTACRNIARWNGTRWLPLGQGTDYFVLSIVARSDGEVIAAGYFSSAGNVACSRIASWNGVSWSPLGSGLNGGGFKLHLLPNDDIIVIGDFDWAGDAACSNIALWRDGRAQPVTPKYIGGWLGALAFAPDGDLVVAGGFTSADGVLCNNIARWNGTRWRPLGDGMNDWVYSLARMPDGDLVAAGNFAVAGGVACNRIARRNGPVWEPLGSGVDGIVYAVTPRSDGSVVAGGQFMNAGGVACNRIAQYNGTAWTAMGTGMNADVYALATLPNGDVVAGGAFTTAGGRTCNRIARWNGTQWSPLGTGVNNAVYALLVLPNGDLIAGGRFTQAGGVACGNIARWNGTAWSPIGGGMNYWVSALAMFPDGTFVAGGGFTAAGGVACNRVARWDGSAWQPLGQGVDEWVYAVAALPNGHVIAGGAFAAAGGVAVRNVARWNGSAWSGIGDGTDNWVSAMLTLPSGEVAVGGGFTIAGQEASGYLAFLPFFGPPPILRQPQTQHIVIGSTMTLSVESAIPGAAVAYRWHRNGVPLEDGDRRSGTASPTLTITNAAASDAGQYWCALTNACGTTTSTAAELTGCNPTITAQPQGGAIRRGESFTLAVQADDAVSHRWRRQGVDLIESDMFQGVATSTLTIATPGSAEAGAYRCLVTTSCGAVLSDEAVVTLPCLGDFNSDGGIDGMDVGVFFEAWEAGQSWSDVNEDGGIDGLDLFEFFDHWESGC